MTQSVERNVRKLIGWLLVCIVAIYGILEGGVGGGVAHHGAVRLGKEPVIALPVGTQRSGLRNLKHLASIRGKIGIDEIRQSMTTVGLDPDLKRPVGKYSLGMRQRLGIAQAIMEQPDLLILDEPMNGLDNQGVEHIRSVLLSLKEKGVTIVLASHFKEDISYLCDEVYQMDAGILTQMT